jgi:hypothetical protein
MAESESLPAAGGLDSGSAILCEGRRVTREAADRDSTSHGLRGRTAKFQQDSHWRDLILFYEYFHGDNGAGVGASQQTGWTGLIAVFLDFFGRVDAKAVLELERVHLQERLVMEQVGGER